MNFIGRYDYYAWKRRIDLIYETVRECVKKPYTILDFGCGDGNISFRLADIPNSKIVGLDISKDKILMANEGAEEKNISNVEFMVCSDSDIDNKLKDRKFNIILCADVIEHLPKPSRFLITISRFLEADGTLIAVIPNRFGVIENTTNNPIINRFYYDPYPHIHKFSYLSFISFAKKSGYVVDECIGVELLSAPLPPFLPTFINQYC
jgi:2-polyprenyl-3-methyl-5-hydroxy-6-metoxy-1,4-benzoquinol methylase